MKNYILFKLMHAAGVALFISVLSFFLLFYTTDPAVMLLPPEATNADIALFRTQMGLDRPIPIQYFDFITGVVLHGDFGTSYVAKVPTNSLIGATIGPTVRLGFAALLVSTVFAIPVGIIAAVRRHSLLDNVSTLLVLVGQAMPLFWLGIMLIIIFGVWLRWLPTSGSDTWWHLILPAVTLGSYLLPLNMRLVRAGMLDVLSQDYIRTARAKGLAEERVVMKHAFRNAAIPLVTVLGVQFGALLGGAVVTETVFAWPGMGRLAVDSIRTGDVPVVQAVVMILAAFTIGANLLADVCSALIDPRIRLG